MISKSQLLHLPYYAAFIYLTLFPFRLRLSQVQVLMAFFLYPQFIEHDLEYSRCSVNVYGLNKYK